MSEDFEAQRANAEEDANNTSQEPLSFLEENQEEGSQLMVLLEELEDTLAQARSLPMSASVLINRAEVLELVTAARLAIPADIQAANSIVSGANAVLVKAGEEGKHITTSAQDEAERVVADAHAQAERLISEQRIVVMAEERADQIIEDATRRAAELRKGANQYSDKMLASLSQQLSALEKQVASGRELLAQRMEDTDTQDSSSTTASTPFETE
ncbi:MAG: hypothetical protein Q4G30_09945 [Actinomycetaceae bacterium]|nr:hypothetical protein [Actinomycetaceae bacterium]